MAIVIGLIGFILALLGTLFLLIEAFRVGILWGLVVLFCHPIGPLLFIIIYWDKAKSAVGYYLLGFVLLVVAGSMPGGRAWRRAAVRPSHCVLA